MKLESRVEAMEGRLEAIPDNMERMIRERVDRVELAYDRDPIVKAKVDKLKILLKPLGPGPHDRYSDEIADLWHDVLELVP